MSDTFPHITALQIKYLMDAYDQYNPSEEIPSFVLKDIARAANVEEKEKIHIDKVMVEDKELFDVADIKL